MSPGGWRWGRAARAGAPAPDERRWLVVDVEASGLDTRRDRLLAIAAVAVSLPSARGATPGIVVGDSFEVVLRHDAAPVDKPNILLHGIGVGAQRAGVEPAQALAAFARWAGDAPLVGYHASFDEAMIGRAAQRWLGASLPNAWLDIAPLAPLLWPDVRGKALDDWLAHFDIACLARHQAAADAFATAELLLRLWPRLGTLVGEPVTVAKVAAVIRHRRWLAV